MHKSAFFKDIGKANQTTQTDESAEKAENDPNKQLTVSQLIQDLADSNKRFDLAKQTFK